MGEAPDIVGVILLDVIEEDVVVPAVGVVEIVVVVAVFVVVVVVVTIAVVVVVSFRVVDVVSDRVVENVEVVVLIAEVVVTIVGFKLVSDVVEVAVTCFVVDSVVCTIAVISSISGIGPVSLSSFLSLDSSLFSTTISLGAELVSPSSTSFSLSSDESSDKGAVKQLSPISTKFSISP